MGKLLTCTAAALFCVALALASPAVADEAAKTPSVAPSALVWVSATEIRLGGDPLIVDTAWQALDQMPIMKDQAPTAYPEAAKEKGLEADVWIQALVGTDGAVHHARVTKQSTHGLEPGFEICALDAAMRNTFEPATKDGKSVAVWVTYPVSFRLK